MESMMRTMPAIPLRGLTVLPTMILNFDVSRETSVRAVEKAMKSDQILFLVTQRDPDEDSPKQEGLYEIGSAARIRNVTRLPKDILRIMAEGICRGRLLGLEDAGGYLEATAELLEEPAVELDGLTREAMTRALQDLLKRYAQLNPKFGRDLLRQLMDIRDLERFTTAVCIHLPIRYEDRQKLLEAPDLPARYECLSTLMVTEMEVLQIRADLDRKVKARIEKSQKDYILREQLKVIQEELGEDTVLADVRRYEEEAQKLNAPEEVRERIRRESGRLRTIGSATAESAVLRGYIETLLRLPWDKESGDNLDLKNARKILEEDHYGLEKVKERVLEFLAVRSLTGGGGSPILCLAGPPGTGKTSIARSIARAMGRKYVRISLGGVRDEAEIRGHRRTYVGAMPGRIAEGIRQAGVKNPLMLLDEIDKLSGDYRGDTASALLEVLDSEQNSRFCDHYIELPLDLSEVLFIATANDVHNIPQPLLDRMELIEVSGYTINEKYHIAAEHLLDRQRSRNGLSKKQLTITKPAMFSLIEHYTHEAGVRQLERRIAELCRRAARAIMEDGASGLRVTEKNLESYLGKKRYTAAGKNEKDDVGIVRGLAWTGAGGVTLQIEVNTMPGTGEFLLTGQLGDVMKESARTAVSYVRSVGAQWKVGAEFFRKNDIHIHIPEGAVPKDGPSAGITMATAVLSAVTGIPVRADLAMTGEITLRGRVLAVGGLKEKLLAAGRAGISEVLAPSENKADIAELSKEVTGGLKITYVSSMPEVLRAALVR